MVTKIENYTEHLLDKAKKFKSKVLCLAAKQPILALSLIIIGSVLLLPLVSAAALYLVVIVFRIMDYLQSKGLLTLTYLIFGQGILLVIIIAILLVMTFSLLTGAGVLHYKFFQSTDAK